MEFKEWWEHTGQWLCRDYDRIEGIAKLAFEEGRKNTETADGGQNDSNSQHNTWAEASRETTVLTPH